MKQLNNNTFGKNSWNRHWKKLYFLRNTLGKILRVATDKERNIQNFERERNGVYVSVSHSFILP